MTEYQFIMRQKAIKHRLDACLLDACVLVNEVNMQDYPSSSLQDRKTSFEDIVIQINMEVSKLG